MIWCATFTNILPILCGNPIADIPAVANTSGGSTQLPTLGFPQEDNICPQVCSSQECVCAQPQEMDIEELQPANDRSDQVDCSVASFDQDQFKDEEAPPTGMVQEYNEQGSGYITNPFPSPSSAPMVVSKTKIPRPRAITVHDKITRTIVSVRTSLLEKPPVTVIHTRVQDPVTTTLPPLVLRVPTTIVRVPRPETVTRVIPPKVIYPPPITTTVYHRIQYPPSTVLLNTILPPIIRTVTVSASPLTVVRVLTSTVSSQDTVSRPQYRATPSSSPMFGSIGPDRINPLLGYTLRDRPMYGIPNESLYGNGMKPYSEAFNPFMYSLYRPAGSLYDRGYDEFGTTARSIYDLAIMRLSNGSRCVRGTNECYISMMSSNLGLPQYDSDCSESDTKKPTQKYPDVISLGEESVASTVVSRSPKSANASMSGEKRNIDKPHPSSGKTGMPKVVYMSELIEENE